MFSSVRLKNKTLETSLFSNYVKIFNSNQSERFYVIPKRYVEKHAEYIRKFEVFDDDVWVISFPKSGTTWTEELVWLVSNDLNYEEAMRVSQGNRFPFLE